MTREQRASTSKRELHWEHVRDLGGLLEELKLKLRPEESFKCKVKYKVGRGNPPGHKEFMLQKHFLLEGTFKNLDSNCLPFMLGGGEDHSLPSKSS